MSGLTQLVLRWSNGQGDHVEAWSGLPSIAASEIMFLAADSQGSVKLADTLRSALQDELRAWPGAISQARPSSGFQPKRPLLVLVSDGVTAFEAAASQDVLDAWPADGAVLPVLPLKGRKQTANLLPEMAKAANARFWSKAIEREALPAVLAFSGLGLGQPRIFISYRQVDCAKLAVQLFDALSHAGFDVFLDHFQIPPGVDFQVRLNQELGDKSILLLLESKKLASSPWVAHEIATAKACSMGLLALNIAGAPESPDIDPDNRLPLPARSFTIASRRLKRAALDAVVTEIALRHDRQLVARRSQLQASLTGALLLAGGKAPRPHVSGAFEVAGKTKKYLVWLTVRSPDLPDFHSLHPPIGVPPGFQGVVIGLSRLMEPLRAQRVDWLASLCAFHLVDEGNLASAAALMAADAL